ncbi:MAG: diguanylate cyclase [Campylobacterales bacterium]|nr:diguanylate cyclase [Campylobacterales bacterium]HEO99239.1 diguanylate cyclase [Campylobacterota bacterium]
MQKEWPSYRITAVLYAIVLLMPVGFYFVHQAFQALQQDTKAIRQSSWLAGGIGHHYLDPTTRQISEKEIENALHDLSSWVKLNNSCEYYIGETTLQKDFQRVEQCWHDYRLSVAKDGKDLPDQNLQCYDSAETLALIIEKMVYLKQHKIVNIFYGSLLLTMLLLIAAIYFVRVYIHLQMKKHAIHDGETGLFNKKYFLSVLQNACAESKRYRTPLCALWISVTFESTADKKAKKQFYREFGTIVSGAIRSSDIAARYSDPASEGEKTLFCILLPMTSKEHGEVLAGRLQETLGTKLSANASNTRLGFSIDAYDQEESCERFIEEGRSVLE